MSSVNEAVPSVNPAIRFFGDLTTNVQLSSISVYLVETAPPNAVLMAPLTLTALLETAKGGLSIAAYDDTVLDPLKSRVHKLEGVLDTVQKFFDEHGVDGPGGTLSIDFGEEIVPPVDVQMACIELVSESIAQGRLSSFEIQLSHALALAVAKNLVYESLIDELSEHVQCSEDSAEENEQAQDAA